LCHHRSRHAAARQWLRTYGGRNPAGASGSPNRLLRDFRWPAVLGEEPARPGGDHWCRLVLAHVWLARSAGSRESPAGIGISPWTGVSLCRLAVRHFMCAITPGRQAAPAWATHGLHNAMTGHGRAGSRQTVPWPASLASC